jgi:glucokinase
MRESFPVLGFDIGGTKIAICLGTSDGKILGSKRINSKGQPPDEVLPQLVNIGKELLKEASISPESLKAIGISAPAPMDILKGTISPTNMKKWVNVPVRDFLAESFGVPTYFDNDANAGALAEWIFGAGKGSKDMLYLTMSTGIGGGIIAKGHLVQGKSYIAGEVGHIVIDVNGPLCNCGMKGCYEAFCGGQAIAQRMQRELAGQLDHPIIKHAGGKIEDVDMRALLGALKENNEYAVNLWKEVTLRNAQAFGIFLNTLSPEYIVLGTIARAYGDLFMKPVLEQLPKFCWKEMLDACTVRTTALGDKMGEYAGICVALNCMYEKGEYSLD